VRTAHLLLLSLLFTTAVAAQSFEEVAGVRLNDTTPRSTRAIAVGGASDSLGDVDIVANPATLTNVKHAMVSVQGTRNSLGFTSLLGTYPLDLKGWTDATSLSQVAAAIPIRGLVAGVYYAAEPRMQGAGARATSFGTTPYAPLQCPTCVTSAVGGPSAFDRAERRYGVALAWERGPVAVGAGAEWQRLREDVEPLRITAGNDPSSPGPVQGERVFRGVDGRDVVANAGVRWRVSPRLALAAAYNGAGSFTRTTSVCAIDIVHVSTCTSAVALLATTTERLPDAWRAGVSFAATDRLRLVAEEVRRHYGRLAAEPYSTFGLSFHDLYHDVTELHAGAEYKLASLALRAGWWRDPSRYDSPYNQFHVTETHRTFGAGINVGSARLDVAYDHSSLATQRRAVAGITLGL